jgi:hypothetical protein
VGCGYVAEARHGPALAAMPGARVAALADPDPIRLERVGEALSVTSRHADHRSLLEDPAVEVVAVCVPVAAHGPIALDVLEAADGRAALAAIFAAMEAATSGRTVSIEDAPCTMPDALAEVEA